MNETQRSYRRRMLAVLAHIQDNLDEPLTLEGLSAVACFSPFHFHRIFLGMTGETVGAHIRRLRLTRAAFRLEFTDLSVTEAGLEAGYDAPEAFSRAFKAQFGEPPSRFREAARSRRREYVAALFPFPEDILNYPKTGAVPMNVTITSKDPLRVACARSTGPYFQSATTAWQKMLEWGGPRNIFTPGARYIGVSHDDPSTTAPEKLRYDACVTVGEDVEGDGGIQVTVIPGGDHAVLVHKGPYEGLEKTYMWLYGVWLPQSGREASMRPCYEVYLNDYRTTPPEELLTEINVPLEPK